MKNIKPNDESGDFGALLVAGLRGTLIGIACTALSALVMTAAALMTEDPDKIIGILAYAALFIGTLICGITAVRSDPGRGFTASLVGGGGYVLVLWLISLFFKGDSTELLSPTWAALGYALCLLTSLVGGLLSRGRRMSIGAGKNSQAERLRRQLGRRA